MIRGFVAVVNSDSPLPDIPAATDWYRKAAVKLSSKPTGQGTAEFFITIEETDYCFKVMENIRLLDKMSAGSGMIRIGFVKPGMDLVILCNVGGLKMFIDTVDVMRKRIEPLGPKSSYSPGSPHSPGKCESCEDLPGASGSCLDCEIKQMNDCLVGNNFTGEVCFGSLGTISLTSHFYLSTINASGMDLVEIPETLGCLPCLRNLDLSNNQLGKATNWNWLMSPFLKENLVHLCLGQNELSSLPEGIVKLKNLEMLNLDGNYLTELPASFCRLKSLRKLSVKNNRLEILPYWMYQKKKFVDTLFTGGNPFLTSDSMSNDVPNLKFEDFEPKVVLSLSETVGSFILSKKIPFWQYNIPSMLAACLEEAYYCHCGSLVLNNRIGQVVRCMINTRHLTVNANDRIVPIEVRCCSFTCYKMLKYYVDDDDDDDDDDYDYDYGYDDDDDDDDDHHYALDCSPANKDILRLLELSCDDYDDDDDDDYDYDYSHPNEDILRLLELSCDDF